MKSFHKVGLRSGDTVCVHSSLSNLGYVVGGADTVIDALMELVGPNGCILMPTFSTSGPMEDFLKKGLLFNVLKTPSKVGLITERFRVHPGVIRSLHPTNSVAAWGRGAKDLIRDHENSITPYGKETPYGRLAEGDDSYILMIDTHIHSLLHHLQERVDFPNLFLPEQKEISVVDEVGRRQKILTKVIRPRIPYFIAIPSILKNHPDWVILHDFALMFPRRREKEVKRLGYHFDGYEKLYFRRNEFEGSRILRSLKVGKGYIGLLHIKSFISKIEPEFRDLIERFRSYYDIEKITSLNLPYS